MGKLLTKPKGKINQAKAMKPEPTASAGYPTLTTPNGEAAAATAALRHQNKNKKKQRGDAKRESRTGANGGEATKQKDTSNRQSNLRSTGQTTNYNIQPKVYNHSKALIKRCCPKHLHKRVRSILSDLQIAYLPWQLEIR